MKITTREAKILNFALRFYLSNMDDDLLDGETMIDQHSQIELEKEINVLLQKFDMFINHIDEPKDS